MATNQALDTGGPDRTAQLTGIGMAFAGKGVTGPGH